ncbi:MAG: DUF6883 domain-containing protein [Myxococcota bacterium]
MSNVGTSWGQWASDVASRAGEVAQSAVDSTEEAFKEAYEDSPVEVAVDYWATHSPNQVTREFRNSTDEFVRERFGETAEKAARLVAVPLGAAARFSVHGVQGFDALSSKATDIATGRAAMPNPGQVISGTAVGIAKHVKQTADAAGNAMVDGAIAVVQGDVEGVAAAAEDAAKAALDIGALVAGGRGAVSAKSALGGGGVMRAAGVDKAFAVGTQGALAAASQVGVSVGVLGVMSQAPMEARRYNAGERNSSQESTRHQPSERSVEGRPDKPDTRAAEPTASATRLRGAERAEIDVKKLTDYALNPAHPVGGNKARVFESALGYTKSNYQGLLDQIRKGVRSNTPVAGKVDRFGSRFTVDIEVTGPSGSATVRTGWILRPGSDAPALTTLFVK